MTLSVEDSVRARYSQGAQVREEALCCPVDYDRNLLDMLPQEIIERDYGCGDPSRYVREGDTVLDLGSGGGKICYMAARLAGPRGYVIGIDMNDDMLDLARRHQPAMARSWAAIVSVSARGVSRTWRWTSMPWPNVWQHSRSVPTLITSPSRHGNRHSAANSRWWHRLRWTW